MSTSISNLLTLPDEILLEIYKYLLSTHILYSFYGLNQRLNRCITGYCRYIALTDVTFDQFHQLCRSILPAIGSQIQTISINNCRSVLEGKIFSQYFSDQMSTIFPHLQKLILVCYAADELNAFLGSLNNLEHLHEIEIHDILTEQTNTFQHVVEANANRFTSIKFKTSFSELPTCSCLNILDLTLSLQTLDKLPYLLSSIPNVRRLNVTIDEISLIGTWFDQLSPLLHLNYLVLRCWNHFWLIEELTSLLNNIPVIEYLSMQISSTDNCFVSSEQKLLDILPKSTREFHFLLRYYYENIEEIDCQALQTSRFPMVCLIDENSEVAVVHTIPYQFPSFNISSAMAKQMASWENYHYVDKFYDYHGMTLAEAYPIIVRCRRLKEIDIQSYDKNEEETSVQQPQKLLTLPTLFRLKRVWLLHSSREYQSFKSLLQVAPNLSELFIAFDNLLPMFEDKDICQLLRDRIIHLLILRGTASAPNLLTEQHVPNLVTTFTHLRHLQIDVTGGSLIESIVLSIMNAFKEQSQLISLVVEGKSTSVELKSNARQWLIDNTHLPNDGKFDAEFKEQTNRFLLWL